MPIRKVILFLLSLSNFATVAVAAPTEFESRVRSAIAKVLPAVLKVTGESNDGPSFGAGFVVDRGAGHVVTNYHVVSRVKSIFVEDIDGKRSACELIHFDAARDLALLKAKDVAALPAELKIALAEPVSVGDFVVAVGSPGGYDFSASLGIVSAMNRDLPDQNSKLKFIQVDAPMYHGSSGGPLANLDGEAIGVNSRGGAQGAAAFAVPAQDLANFMAALKEKKERGPAKFGYLGAVLQPLSEEIKKALRFNGQAGVVVAEVFANSAAAHAGIKSADILMQLGNIVLEASVDEEIALVENYVVSAGPGAHDLKLFREGKEVTVQVNLSESAPCVAETIEHDKTSALMHRQQGCYWFPAGEFVEVTRFWDVKSASKGLKPGDLVIKVNGSAQELAHKVRMLLAPDSTESAILTVLRKGRPLLVALQR